MEASFEAGGWKQGRQRAELGRRKRTRRWNAQNPAWWRARELGRNHEKNANLMVVKTRMRVFWPATVVQETQRGF